MIVFALLVAAGVFIIHYWNGGTLEQLLPLTSIIVLFWMADMLTHLHIMSLPTRRQIKAIKKSSEFLKSPEGKAFAEKLAKMNSESTKKKED